MAAPMKSCLVTVSRAFTRYSSVRWYSRRLKRSIQNVHTPEEDVHRTKNVNSVANPRNNPFVPFLPKDPVQKSISELVDSKDKAKPPKNPKHKGDSRKSVSKVFTTASGLNYEILEEEDRRFGRVLLQAKQKKSREELNQVVLEGKNLIRDATAAGVKLISLYFSRVEALDGLPEGPLRDASLYKVQYRHLQLWSDVDTPQGLIGLFEMPPVGEALQPVVGALPLTLICDSIREPGNLGTLLRSAAAVGCKQVIATKGCVDIWNSKVVRSAAGCHFRVPIICDVTWPQIPAYLGSPDSLNVFIADCSHPTASRVGQLSGSTHVAQRIEAAREQDMFKDSVSAAEMNDVDHDQSDSDWPSADLDIDDSYRDRKLLSLYQEAPLNVSFYDDVNYTGSRVGNTGSHVNYTGSHVDNTGSYVDNTGSRVDNTGSHVNYTGSHIDNTGSYVDNTGSYVDNTGSYVDNTGSHIDNTGSHVNYTGSHVDNTGSHVDNTGSHVDNTGSYVDNTGSHVVIVISGETSGVSAEARKLAYDHYGQCVMIPMAAGVDSLNCAIAGSIILYEAGKQFRTLRRDQM